jgi:hypothetical protein
MSLLDKASLICTPNAVKADKLYSIVPSSGAGDMNVVRATTATRVNSLGLIENVALNVARLDYSNGSCPSILVEPQRTNLLLRSEGFENSIWFKGNLTITPNSIDAPNGTLTADTYQPTLVDSAISGTNLNLNVGSYAAQVWVKGTALSIGNTMRFWLWHLTSTGTTGLKTVTLTADWQLVTILPTVTAIGDTRIRFDTTDHTNPFYIWGAQLEQGAYPTSYIPTVASVQTRNADLFTVSPPVGTVKITTTFSNDTTEIITTIPATYTAPNGKIKLILMQHTL